MFCLPHEVLGGSPNARFEVPRVAAHLYAGDSQGDPGVFHEVFFMWLADRVDQHPRWET